MEEVRRIIDSLLVILDDPELWELRRDMSTFLRRSVLPARLPGVEIPELQDLQETKIMLEERAATWPKKWMAQRYRKGRPEGRLEGQRVALAEFIEEKFGSLAAEHKSTIANASEDRLRQWLKKIVAA